MAKRGFVDFEDGQIHYRAAGRKDAPPLVMLHASPGSSKQLEPLIDALGASRRVIAPDTLGNGDSAPPKAEQPEIADYAEATLAAIAAFGYDTVDLYGTHTGARIATHIALTRPETVRKLILDGFGVYTPDDIDEILKVYAPQKAPDQLGLHVMWAWHFCRDQFVYFPWFKKDRAHRTDLDLPDAESLHLRFVEIAKALTTYHKSYRAAFRYSMREHVPQIQRPTLITFAETDMVRHMFDAARALLPAARAEVLPGTRTPETLAATVAAFEAFLEA